MLGLRAAAIVASLSSSAAHAQEQPAPPADAAPAEPEPPEKSDRKSWLKGWSGAVDFGLNGASGNTENFNARGALALQRKTDLNDTKIAFSYLIEADDGDKSESRGELMLRNDRTIADSRWTLFTLSRVEYDEFKDWRWRLTLAGGLGFKFLDTERTTLIGRVGPAATREFGGIDEDWHFEPLIGADLEHRVNPRSKLYANIDYFLSADEYPDYRFLAKAGYEVLLDPESKMTFKIGIEDEYDQSPGPGIRRNDFRYFVTLGWVF